MSTRIVHGCLRAVLCAGVSIAALGVTAPALAADLVAKSAPVLRGETRLWLEGGAFWTGGDNIPYADGLAALFGDGGRGIPLIALDGIGGDFLGGGGRVIPKVGWDVGAGFDHRFAGTRWHVNGEFRYGTARGSNSLTTSILAADPDPGDPFLLTASINTDTKLTERHWHADIGVGYDVLIGPSTLQVKFGLRAAEVAAKTVADTGATLTVISGAPPPDVTTASASNTTTVIRSFLGIGPRVGLEGSVPLIGAWTLDYKGDAALLFGNTKIDSDSVTSFSIASPGFILSISGIPSSSYWSKSITVMNADIQAGIGYWITPNWKISASYRLDVFIDPLRASPDDALPAQSIDRYYHGPKLTMTGRW
jgi:hypothetical protein